MSLYYCDESNKDRHLKDEQDSRLLREKMRNNPNNEPTGNFTGRCMRCGSNSLWDDHIHYGCNNCKTILG